MRHHVSLGLQLTQFFPGSFTRCCWRFNSSSFSFQVSLRWLRL